ncbi:Uncharacterized protein Fot_28116 [Forsythia ovata]|uniref:Uncharacterized protein n=1 Tax=Forsythia ovata TaxID=205694 RepID=A0ABD1TNX6_9LAMI
MGKGNHNTGNFRPSAHQVSLGSSVQNTEAGDSTNKLTYEFFNNHPSGDDNSDDNADVSDERSKKKMERLGTIKKKPQSLLTAQMHNIKLYIPRTFARTHLPRFVHVTENHDSAGCVWHIQVDTRKNGIDWQEDGQDTH